MKYVVCFLLTLLSFGAFSQSAIYCGDIKRLRTWGVGSNTYNVWIEYVNNPASCTGGFYMKPATQNEDFIYSLALSAKAANQRVCIQSYESENNGNRCLLHYIMHE